MVGVSVFIGLKRALASLRSLLFFFRKRVAQVACGFLFYYRRILCDFGMRRLARCRTRPALGAAAVHAQAQGTLGRLAKFRAPVNSCRRLSFPGLFLSGGAKAPHQRVCSGSACERLDATARCRVAHERALFMTWFGARLFFGVFTICPSVCLFLYGESVDYCTVARPSLSMCLTVFVF